MLKKESHESSHGTDKKIFRYGFSKENTFSLFWVIHSGKDSCGTINTSVNSSLSLFVVLNIETNLEESSGSIHRVSVLISCYLAGRDKKLHDARQSN